MTHQNLNLPNLLTGLRLLAAPLVALMLLHGHDAAALALFAVAGLTDAADGWLAKQFGWATPLGRILDPAADKLLMLFAFCSLAAIGAVPVWLAAVVIGRDGVLIVGFALAWALGRPTVIPPSPVGKASTLLQVLFVATTLAARSLGLDWPHGRAVLLVGVVVLTVGSGLLYAARWFQALVRPARAI